MARLFRPHIPLSVRCAVAERQLVGLSHPKFVTMEDRHFAHRLGWLLRDLATRLGCEVSELHLDHNPALGAREKVVRAGVHIGYRPHANDPEFLLYREASAHRLKTNVKGDGAQHPDRVLIKKQRRLERGPKPKRGPKIQSRGFGQKSRPFPKRVKK